MHVLRYTWDLAKESSLAGQASWARLTLFSSKELSEDEVNNTGSIGALYPLALPLLHAAMGGMVGEVVFG